MPPGARDAGGGGHASPLAALAMPGAFLLCKYSEFRQKRRDANSRRVTERELQSLHNKIVSAFNKILHKLWDCSRAYRSLDSRYRIIAATKKNYERLNKLCVRGKKNKSLYLYFSKAFVVYIGFRLPYWFLQYLCNGNFII